MNSWQLVLNMLKCGDLMVLEYKVLKSHGKVVVNLNQFYVVKVYLNLDMLLELLKVN